MEKKNTMVLQEGHQFTEGVSFWPLPMDELELDILSGTTGFCAYFDADIVQQFVAEFLSNDIAGTNNTIPNIWTTNLPVNGSRFGQALNICAQTGVLPDHDFLSSLLAELIGTLLNIDGRLTHKRRNVKHEIIARLETARTFIMASVNRDITLEEIAQTSCLSKFHLTRLFASTYGLPPLRYHQNLRLDKCTSTNNGR